MSGSSVASRRRAATKIAGNRVTRTLTHAARAQPSRHSHSRRAARAQGVMRGIALLLLLLYEVVGVEVQLGVLELEPERSLELSAAAGAGLRAAARRLRAEAAWLAARRGSEEPQPPDGDVLDLLPVEVVPVEPGELLDVPKQVCDAANENKYNALLSGVSVGVPLAAAAAARAGLPLLLVNDVPEAEACWEALAMYPRAELALAAARDLVREKGWARAALLHAGSASAAAQLAPEPDRLHLLARQLPADDDMLRDLMLVLKKAGYVNFLVWGDEVATVRVLDAAQRVGLLAARHSYILLSFETHTQDLHDYSHGGANITGLMLFDPEAESTINATEAWREEYAQLGLNVSAEYTARSVPSALLLAQDAAQLAARALAALQLPPARADCTAGYGAANADTLLNYIRSVEDYGVTGILSWEADGWRRHIVLQVVELQRGGQLQVAGSWSQQDGVRWTRAPLEAEPLPTDSMSNRTFTVMIAMNDPYVMKRESTQRLSGNMRYEGFCIELIETLAEMLNFNYTFVQQEGNGYGSYNAKTKQWEGMLRTVMDDKSNLTLAITDLTITEEREKVVDFTTPFMNLGIAILFRKPKPPEPKMFAFLLPFSNGVWVCLGFVYVLSSLLLYVVGRLCPEEWQNPYPCIEEPVALENQFTLGNAFWFNLGAILLQGSEVAPVGYSTRAVASVWWLFALVITSSYTANLASLLAAVSSNEEIHDVNDLAYNDRGITYGAKATGSTYTFFEHAKAPIFRTMFENMKKWNKLPDDNKKGIAMAANEEENYAFLMESTSIEYEVERNCQVYMVGEQLDSKGYGIAMAKSSPYRQELNLALLRLQESGKLREMKHSWWKERNGGGACKAKDDIESPPLEMNSFYGLFMVLVVGCVFGLVLSCGDLAVHTRRHPREPDLSFWQNFLQELRFVFHFELAAKPVKGPLMPPKTPSIHSPEPEELEVETDAEQLDEEGAGGGGEGGNGRDSALSGPRRRRRSSMHTASMKLARHAHGRNSDASALRHA
ncbi:hypothetical protein O0L34_g5181 [Tuta absoluta]|nr:hypothetical protein O0L34_g5181 [Tuta absoluta]